MINTRSTFFTLDPVDTTNFYLDFKEGAGSPLFAEIAVGDYTHSELPAAVEAALNQAGALTYSVTFDRVSRKFTISASGAFTLLVASGAHVGNDIFSLMGFSGADTSSATAHVANAQSGTEYRPQFYLQDYVDQADNQKSINPVVARTANGQIEVVKFGTEKFFEFQIRLATNVDQGETNFIETDATGYEKLRTFMQFCVTKNGLEFMPDRDNKAIFYKVLLESTEASKDGTGYKLKELFDKDLAGYFDSGKLVYRLRE